MACYWYCQRSYCKKHHRHYFIYLVDSVSVLGPVGLFLPFCSLLVLEKKMVFLIVLSNVFHVWFQVFWSLRDLPSRETEYQMVNQWQKHYRESSLRCFIAAPSPMIGVKVITKYGCRKTFTPEIHYFPRSCRTLGQQRQGGSRILVSCQLTAMNTFYMFLPSLCF